MVLPKKEENNPDTVPDSIPKKTEQTSALAGFFNKKSTTNVTDAEIQKQIEESGKKQPDSKSIDVDSKPAAPLLPPRSGQPSTTTPFQPSVPSIQPIAHGQGLPSTGFGVANRFLAN